MQITEAYRGDHTAGADAVVESHPALVVGEIALIQVVLIAHVVRPLVDHPAATLHLDGVAAAEVGVQVGAFSAALVRASLEVPILVECDLKTGQSRGGVVVLQDFFLDVRSNKETRRTLKHNKGMNDPCLLVSFQQSVEVRRGTKDA